MAQDGSVFSYGDSSFDSTNISHFCSNWSLESRDNPFLPGGDLSKEAEELLKKATIVRDKFFLEQEQEKLLQEAEQQQQQQLAARPDLLPDAAQDAVDGTLPNNASEVLEERISPSAARQVRATAAAAAASPLPPQPRENGKPGDVPALEASSPGKVQLEEEFVGGDNSSSSPPPAADGSSAAVANDTDAEQQDKDKVKRRPKCCLLM